jgi:hypothetical protein
MRVTFLRVWCEPSGPATQEPRATTTDDTKIAQTFENSGPFLPGLNPGPGALNRPLASLAERFTLSIGHGRLDRMIHGPLIGNLFLAPPVSDGGQRLPLPLPLPLVWCRAPAAGGGLLCLLFLR